MSNSQVLADATAPSGNNLDLPFIPISPFAPIAQPPVETTGDKQLFSLPPRQFNDIVERNRVPVSLSRIKYFLNPAAGITPAALKLAYHVTDSQLEAVSRKEDQRVIFEYVTHLPFFPLLSPADSVTGTDLSRRQAALASAGLPVSIDPSNGAIEMPGTLMVRFNYRENSTEIKDYFIYWVKRNANNSQTELLIASRVNDQEGTLKTDNLPPDALAYIRGLQRLLKQSGALAQNKDADRFDEQSAQALYSYLVSHQTLLQPNINEARGLVKSLQERYHRTREIYNSVKNDKELGKEVRSKQLYDLAMEMLQINTNIYLQAKQYAETFSDPALRQKFAAVRDHALLRLNSQLDAVYGLRDVDSARFFHSGNLFAAENEFKNYFEEKKKGKKEDELDLNSVQEKYLLIYRSLIESERRYAFIPGMPQRSQALRAEVKARLETLMTKQKEHKSAVVSLLIRLDTLEKTENARTAANEADRSQIIYEQPKELLSQGMLKLEDLAQFGGNAKPIWNALVQGHFINAAGQISLEETKRTYAALLAENTPAVIKDNAREIFNILRRSLRPDQVGANYENAFGLSRLIGADPARPIVISLFHEFAGDNSVALSEITAKFGQLAKDRPEKELAALGRLLWTQQMYSSLGFSPDQVRAKTAALSAAAQPALHKLEELCKNKENPVAGNQLTNSLKAMVRIFYGLQATYNRRADSADKKATFSGISDLLGKVSGYISNNRLNIAQVRAVFKILTELPEDDIQLAESELANKAARDTARSYETSRYPRSLDALRFNQAVKEFIISPRMIADLAQTASRGQGAPYSGGDLNFFFAGKLDAGRPYMFSRSADNPGNIIFSPAGNTLPTMEERFLSGTVHHRELSDLLQLNGGAVLNIALAGQAEATGALHLQGPGIAVDAIGPRTIQGLLTVAGGGETYEIEGGLNLPQYDQKILEKALNYTGENGLASADKDLLHKAFLPNARFTAEETAQLRGLAGRLLSAKLTNLSPAEQIVFQRAASAVKQSVNLHLYRKEGLDRQETGALRQMNDYMERFRFVLPGGRFTTARSTPPSHVLAAIPKEEHGAFIECYQKNIAVFQKLHFQAQKMATLYLPEEDIPNGWGWASLLLRSIAKGAGETISAPPVHSFQLAGLPPAQILDIKTYLYQDRANALQTRIKLFAKLQTLADRAAKLELSEPEKAELKQSFKLTDNAELDALIDNLRKANEQVNKYTKAVSALTAHQTRLEEMLKGKRLTDNELNQFGPKFLSLLKNAKIVDELGRVVAGFENRVQSLQIDDQQKGAVKTLLRQAQGLEARVKETESTLEGIGQTYKSQYLDFEKEKSLIDSSKAKGKEQEELQKRFSHLSQLEGQLSRIISQANSFGDDPVQAMGQLETVQQTIAHLLSDNGAIRCLDAGKQDEREMRIALEGALKAIDPALAGVVELKAPFIQWLEVKQQKEIKLGEETDFFTSDRFTEEDFQKLAASNLGVILDDPGLLNSTVKHLFAQQDAVLFGANGRALDKTPRQALQDFFDANRGSSLGLSSTAPEWGEDLSRTYAKLALTKIFERLPMQGKGNFLMPALMMAFGRNHKLGGIFSWTRETAHFTGRLTGLGDSSFGGTAMREKADIINNWFEQAKYTIMSSLAAESNTTAPYTSLSSQLHYLMIYANPTGGEYLKEKLSGSGDDISLAMNRVTKKDFEAFKAFVKASIRKIQLNLVSRQKANQLIESGFVTSEIMKKAVAETRTDVDYEGDIAPLWTGGEQSVDLADPLHAGDLAGLAILLQDMLRISPHLNDVRSVGDYSRHSMTSNDLQRNVMAQTGLSLADPTAKPLEEVRTLEDVYYNTKGEVDVKTAAGSSIHLRRFGNLGNVVPDAINWTELYGAETWQDILNVRNHPVESTTRQLKHLATGLIKTADFGWKMGRTIPIGLSAIFGGLADYLAARKLGNEGEKNKALAKILEGLGSTIGSFAVFETLPELFWVGIKTDLENGNYGGAIGQALSILMVFAGGGIGTKLVKNFCHNMEIRLDNGLHGRMRALRPYMIHTPQGIGARLISSPFRGGIRLYQLGRAVHAGGIRAGLEPSRTGALSLELSPGVKIFAGAESRAKVDAGRLSRGLHKANYYGRRIPFDGSSKLARGWQVARGFAGSFVDQVGANVSGLARIRQGRTPSIALPGTDEAAIDFLRGIKANPEGQTTLAFSRKTPASAAKRQGLAFEMELLEQLRLAQTDPGEAQLFNDQLGRLQSKKSVLDAEVAKTRTTVSVKNSDLWHWIEKGKVDLPKLAEGKFPAGNLVELNSQMSQLKAKVDANLEAINEPVKAGPTAPARPETNAIQLMEKLARGGEALTRNYDLELRPGRKVTLRGDQLVRLMDAVAKNRPFDFVADWGMSVGEAGAVVQDFSGQFASSGAPERLSRLARTAAQLTVATPMEARLKALGVTLTEVSRGAFHNVEPELLDRFEDAVRNAKKRGLRVIQIEAGVAFSGEEGGKALSSLCNQLELNQPLEKIVVSHRRGGYVLSKKGTLTDTRIVLLDGRPVRAEVMAKLGEAGVRGEVAGAFEKISRSNLDPRYQTVDDFIKAALKARQRGFTGIQVEDKIDLSTKEGQKTLRAVNKLLKAKQPPATIRLTQSSGQIKVETNIDISQPLQPIQPASPAETAKAAAAGRKVSDFLGTPKGKTWFRSFIKTPRGRLFVKSAATGGGFIVSLFAAGGVEEILKQLGVPKALRFGAGLGVAHVVNNAAQKAFVSGFKAGSTGQQLKGLGEGVAYGFLASTLYNGMLNTAEVGQDSWLRSSLPQLGAGIGGAMLLQKFAGRAALPLAIVAAANEIPGMIFSDTGFELRKTAQDKSLQVMARAWNNQGDFLALSMLFLNNIPITNNFGAAGISGTDIKEAAEERQTQLDAAGRNARLRLAALWQETDAPTLAYDSTEKPASFFRGLDLPAEKLAGLLSSKVEFSEYEERYDGSLARQGADGMPGSPYVRVALPPNDPRAREARAYRFLTEQASKLSSEEISRKLTADFGLTDVNSFMQKVAVKQVQEEVATLLGSGSQEVERITGRSASAGLAELFDRDGTLKKGKGAELVSWTLGDKANGLKTAVVEERKLRRVAALLQGTKASAADIELGLANRDGSVNENSPVYITFLKGAERSLLSDLG